jgi:protein SCO1
MKRILLFSLIIFFTHSVYAEQALPSDSIYQIEGTWQTESNQSIQLKDFVGKQQVIALIFTGCSTSCPIIVESMKRVENKIPPNMRDKIGFILVTLTPELDSPKILKAFADKKGLNQNWKILRGNNELVRSLSNALNGRYKMIKEDDVAHSNTVTLLNKQGQIQVQASGTLTGIKPIIEAIE